MLPTSMPVDTDFDTIYVEEPSEDIELALQLAENRLFGTQSGTST
jgi:hypothetical protein